MDVVGDSAYCQRTATYIIDYATDILEDFGEIFYAHGYPRAFHMEDDVQIELCICVCHD